MYNDYLVRRFDNKGCTGDRPGVKDDLEQEAGICTRVDIILNCINIEIAVFSIHGLPIQISQTPRISNMIISKMS